MEKTTIVCVIGPTASGKSSRAIQIAKERDGEVISVDSRQVYRMLDIGTEKMTTEDMEGIPHHLIDVRDPKESYSAGDFVADATRLIEDITSRGRLPILAGGTHFYFDALLNGLPIGSTNAELRTRLEDRSTEELFTEICVRDPRRGAELDSNNRRRLIRALELIDAHGSVPVRKPNETYDVEWVALLPEKEELRDRIKKRLETTLTRGLLEEVKRMREYVGDARLHELGLEYRIIGAHLRGELSETVLLPTLISKLHQYARRQTAWLRKLTGSK